MFIKVKAHLQVQFFVLFWRLCQKFLYLITLQCVEKGKQEKVQEAESSMVGKSVRASSPGWQLSSTEISRIARKERPPSAAQEASFHTGLAESIIL